MDFGCSIKFRKTETSQEESVIRGRPFCHCNLFGKHFINLYRREAAGLHA